MLFILKIVRDGVISGKFMTPWDLRTIPVGPQKNLDFSEFWLAT